MAKMKKQAMIDYLMQHPTYWDNNGYGPKRFCKKIKIHSLDLTHEQRMTAYELLDTPEFEHFFGSEVRSIGLALGYKLYTAGRSSGYLYIDGLIHDESELIVMSYDDLADLYHTIKRFDDLVKNSISAYAEWLNDRKKYPVFKQEDRRKNRVLYRRYFYGDPDELPRTELIGFKFKRWSNEHERHLIWEVAEYIDAVDGVDEWFAICTGQPRLTINLTDLKEILLEQLTETGDYDPDDLE